MKKNYFLAGLFSALFVISAYSQEDPLKLSPQVQQEFNQRKEIYFSFERPTDTQLRELSKVVSIDHSGVKATEVYAYANEKEFRRFLHYGLSYTVQPHPGSQFRPSRMIESVQEWRNSRSAFGAYPTYAAYLQIMQQFETDYPNLCKLYNIGQSGDGRDILVLKITDNLNIRENEPQFLYTSSMHGDEIAGYPMMLSLIDYLLSNYGSDPKVTYLVNNVEIWINPLANPDGTYAGGNNSVTGATRGNSNGIDLNRNYPDPQDGLHPDGNSWQPETIVFMGFADTMDFVMSANFHGGEEVVNYPWDTWTATHADEAWWIYESRRWADSCQANSPAGYMDGSFFNSPYPGVTNGFDWYEVDGGRQDYMNWFHQCREITVELSMVKLVQENQLIPHWNYNKASLLNYMEQSLYGIRGLVTDACTGQPVKAKIFVNSHDFDSSFVYSSLPVGNYHRPIYQGNYSITVSAPGYQSQTINNINVSFNTATVVDVSLQPNAPNASFDLAFDGCDGIVDFSDLTGSASSWTWYFGDGNTSADQNPVHQYSSTGQYNVSLVVQNCAGSDSVGVLNTVDITVGDSPIGSDVNASGCAPQSVTLSATASGVINWYDAQSGGNLLGTGNTYSTPVISNTTTYYAENQIIGSSQYGGPADNTIGTGGFFTGGTYHYIQFDAFTDFTLVSVQVYANGAGNRTVELRNSSGTVLQSSTINIPNGGSRITLNFQVPQGTGYQLGMAGTNNMYRNSAGANYPYTLSGVFSITNSSAGVPGYYYYCYDWEVQTNCTSSRTPISAVFTGTGPSLTSSISAPSVSLCQGETFTFTATGGNATGTLSYQWNVNGNNAGTNSSTFSTSSLSSGDVVTCVITSSDGCQTNNPATSNSISVTVNPNPPVPMITQNGMTLTSSSATGNQWYFNGNPISGATSDVYMATQDGSYLVEVTDGNGCTSISNPVIINTTGVDELDALDFSYYPNPADDQLLISIKDPSSVLVIELSDAIGRIVHRTANPSSKTVVNIQSLPEGFYFIRLIGNGNQKTQRLVISR